MKGIRNILHSEVVKTLLGCTAAVGSGFLLSMGTVSGVASTLAAALAGICTPLYTFSILLGALLAYTVSDAPEGMQFLMGCLAAITCLRILFRDVFRPHVLAVMTVFSCVVAGIAVDLVFHSGSGKLPIYIMEALLTGIAAFFIADAADCLRQQRRIAMNAGKSFTFAICYLLSITALCGIDFSFCNIGRVTGTAITLVFARQFRQNSGTLLGALTACGITLCSVKLGMPMLFLPITAMMMGFLAKMPNALYIPIFFLMQSLSSAVLDSSIGLAKILVELALACTLYGLFNHVELERFLITESIHTGQSCVIRQEQFLGQSLRELQEETAAVMHRLTIPEPEDTALQIEKKVCTGCKNHDVCWQLRSELTRHAIMQLLHAPYQNPIPAALDNCIRRRKLMDTMTNCSRSNALQQMQRVHMMQNRALTLEYLQLLENMACDAAKRRSGTSCVSETAALKNILRRCACEEAACFVYRLRSGRYAAEIYTHQTEFPLNSVQELLSERLGIILESIRVQQNTDNRICLYEEPAYYLKYNIYSVNAPEYERCGDHADAFTDAQGNQYLILSDGMGSGSTASLASRIAVRTFRRMVCSEMSPETAIRMVNTMLLSETNTENFATLDVLILDADSGELTLYKSGAAATLFYRKGQLQRVASPSFPVGIVPDAMPYCRRMTAYDQDSIIMLSDGIGEAEYPYIRQLIQQGLSLEEITKAVCEKAEIFLGGEVRDDMTVIAARICSRQPSDLTNFVTNSTPQNSQIAVKVTN